MPRGNVPKDSREQTKRKVQDLLNQTGEQEQHPPRDFQVSDHRCRHAQQSN
jgi:hypothetical protein